MINILKDLIAIAAILAATYGTLIIGHGFGLN